MDITAAEHRERISLLEEARAAYRAMAAFDRSIELDPALRELVKIRASQLNGCAYCIDAHTAPRGRPVRASSASTRWRLGGRVLCSPRGSAPRWGWPMQSRGSVSVVCPMTSTSAQQLSSLPASSPT